MDIAMTIVGRLTLFRQFSQLRPIPGQPISAYFSRLLNISNQLAGTSEAIPDMVLKTTFSRLPEMFKICIKMLQSQANVTIHRVMSDLKECGLNKTLATKPDAVSKALYPQQGGRGGTRGGRGWRGNHRGGRGGSDQRPQMWCSWCSTNTHNFENCWKKDSNNNQRPRAGGDRKSDSGATDAAKQEISGNTVQSAGMEVEMEAEMEMEIEMMEVEVVSTVKAMDDTDGTGQEISQAGN